MRGLSSDLLTVRFALSIIIASFALSAHGAEVELSVDAAHPGEAIDLTRYALGQGGLSAKPMFDVHVDAIRQLHPRTIRIFVQEFFELCPKRGRYHWNTLDRVIETVAATGAKPILCLCFKPPTLYPKIDQRVVHPADYKGWDELIFQLVKHCNKDKKFGIEYWEIANEPDIGEDGGCPYLFQPEDYLTYYTHTARSIRRASPAAKVGGPALAGYHSAIGTALIEYCGKGGAPLDFFSWHIYNNDPNYFRKSIHEIRDKLAKFPTLKTTEMIIDEWNMSLDQPVLDPAFQPAFILETTFGFLEEGLGRSSYYHIRDWFVDEGEFARFMSPQGVTFMARWWNDNPQYDGLYDNQARVRPAYHAFKLLSLLRGRQLSVEGAAAGIRALACKTGSQIQVVVWNFPELDKTSRQEVGVRFIGLEKTRFRVAVLDPTANVNQLKVERQGRFDGNSSILFSLQPYQIRWITINP